MDSGQDGGTAGAPTGGGGGWRCDGDICRVHTNPGKSFAMVTWRSEESRERVSAGPDGDAFTCQAGKWGLLTGQPGDGPHPGLWAKVAESLSV